MTVPTRQSAYPYGTRIRSPRVPEDALEKWKIWNTGKDGGQWGKMGEIGRGDHHKITTDKWQKNGEKRGGGMGEKREKKCDEIPMFPNPIFPILPEAAELSITPFTKLRIRYSDGKWGKSKVCMDIRKFGYPGGLTRARCNNEARKVGPRTLSHIWAARRLKWQPKPIGRHPTAIALQPMACERVFRALSKAALLCHGCAFPDCAPA